MSTTLLPLWCHQIIRHLRLTDGYQICADPRTLCLCLIRSISFASKITSVAPRMLTLLQQTKFLGFPGSTGFSTLFSLDNPTLSWAPFLGRSNIPKYLSHSNFIRTLAGGQLHLHCSIVFIIYFVPCIHNSGWLRLTAALRVSCRL